MENLKGKEQEDKFIIDDDNKADWALQKIKEHKETIKEKEQLAEQRINQIETWLEEETEKIENEIENLRYMLYEYAEQLKEENPDLKTHSLPFGKLKFRKQRAKWRYKDELLDYAEKNIPDVIKTKKQVNKRELKKKCEVVNGKVINKETGEVIEGVEIEERGEKFDIKVEGE